MLWTELCSPKLICWSPKPNVTVSGNKVCRWWFRLSEVISPNLIGLWPLKKRKRARSLSAMWGHSGKVTICSSSKELSPDTEPVGTLILDLLSPELCENRWQLFKPPRLYDFCYGSQSRLKQNYSDYLFLLEWSLGDGFFQRICLFHPSCQIYWQKVVHSISLSF